jgi:choline dehydrogenase-like flavoprotein
VADGSAVPCALGVNPALTISAIALRVADQMLDEWDQIPAPRATARPATLACRPKRA